MTLKHFVEYFYPGIIVSDSSAEETKHRDYTKIKVPKEAYGFKFYDREVIVDNGEILKGKSKNHSSMFYHMGQIMTKADVKKRVKKNYTLLSNMRINEWEKVIKTKFNQFMPYEKGDVIIG